MADATDLLTGEPSGDLALPSELPILPLLNTVVFPQMVAPLLVTRQDRAEDIRLLEQRLMQRHAGAAGIGKNMRHSLTNKRFHQNIRAVECQLTGLGLLCCCHDFCL